MSGKLAGKVAVRLHQRNERAVQDARHRQPAQERRRLARRVGEERDRQAQEAVGAHLQQHAGEDHATGGRRLDVGVRQPGVERQHRHLDGEGQREGHEQPASAAAGPGAACSQVESGSKVWHLPAMVQYQDRHQHQHAAGHRVEEELDRGVDRGARRPRSPISRYIGISIASQKT